MYHDLTGPIVKYIDEALIEIYLKEHWIYNFLRGVDGLIITRETEGVGRRALLTRKRSLMTTQAVTFLLFGFPV